MKTYGGQEIWSVPPFLSSALDNGEWSTSRHGRFTPGERSPGTHSVRGWVGRRAGLSLRLESYVTTDGQSSSLSWNKAPIWDLRPDFYYSLTFAGLTFWGALSDERTGLSFTTAGGPRQRSHFRVRFP
jgi:hypothetical protein